MAEKMTLKMVRDEMRMIQGNVRVTCTKENVGEWADAIDAHLAQPARAVDVVAMVAAIDELRRGDCNDSECLGLANKLTRAIGNAQAEGR